MSTHRSASAVQLLLTLRQFPGFADAELSELAIVAENLEPRMYAAGEPVVSGPPPRTGSAVHLIVEGKLVSSTGQVWEAHEMLGGLEALARRRRRETVVAEVPTRTLRLGARDYREILEDNFGLLTIVRRSLARALLAAGAGGAKAVTVQAPDVMSDAPLGMVERLIVLRQRMPFGASRVEALAALAQASEEVRLPAGEELGRAGEMPSGALILLDGTAQIVGTGAPIIVGPGYSAGALETLADTPFTTNITALTPVRGLRCPSAALWDVLEDHTDFALAMLEKLASSLLELGVEPVQDVGVN